MQAMVCLPGMVESEFHGSRSLAGRPGVPPLMSAVDCARAIVAGLALGEVVCVPGLDDAAAVFERFRDLQQQTLAAGNRSGRLAARYGARRGAWKAGAATTAKRRRRREPGEGSPKPGVSRGGPCCASSPRTRGRCAAPRRRSSRQLAA